MQIHASTFVFLHSVHHIGPATSLFKTSPLPVSLRIKGIPSWPLAAALTYIPSVLNGA